MDLNEIKHQDDIAVEQDINAHDDTQIKDNKDKAPVITGASQEEDAISPLLTDAERAELIKQYIETGGIACEYRSENGLYIKLREPCQEVFTAIFREIDKDIAPDEEFISIDRVNIIRSNNMLAAYIEKFCNQDYRALQGDKYDTVDGFIERKKIIYAPGGLNMFAVEWALEKLDDMRAKIREAFGAESLKNL